MPRKLRIECEGAVYRAEGAFGGAIAGGDGGDVAVDRGAAGGGTLADGIQCNAFGQAKTKADQMRKTYYISHLRPDSVEICAPKGNKR